MFLNPLQVILSILGVTIFGLFSLRAGMVDHTGFVSGTVMGSVVLIFGGLSWFIILVSFLVFASLFTRYRYDQKKTWGVAEEKGGARSWRNVIANVLLASLSALGYGISSSNVFEAIFLGTISAAAADTLATEIGLLSRSEPRLITNLNKRVSRGTSGGVSPLGEIASLFGTFLVGFVSWIIGFGDFDELETFMIVLLSGFLGSTLDSVLGSTIQSCYKCSVCGKTTEKRIHCEKPGNLIKGSELIDNNVVNFVSIALGALIALVVFSLKIL